MLIFLHLTASGGTPYGIRAGAGEAGMAYACVMKEGFWSSFHNQALMAFSKSYSFGFNYDNRFGIRELGTRTAAALIPAGKACIGAVYSGFGYSDFRRDFAGLGCGLKLSEKIAAGVQADYFSERTSGEYDNSHYLTFEAGLVILPSENIRLGMHVFNPIPGSVRKNKLPMAFSTGAGIELSKVLFAAIEAEMSTGSYIDIRTGVEYQAVKKLWLRAGFGTLNNSFCFGTGYQFGIVTLDLGFRTHDRLGISSSVSLIFKIR